MKAWIWYLPDYIKKRKIIRQLAKWLCGKVTGHVENPTEHGYAGGNFCDHWCRYCDGMFQFPRKECPRGDWMEELFNSPSVKG